MLSTTLKPLLTDFGLSRQIIASVSESTTTSGGSLRWKAPELVDEGEGKANKRSDVWALGMTIVVSERQLRKHIVQTHNLYSRNCSRKMSLTRE